MRISTSFLLALLVALAGCGGGGAPTFDLVFEPAGGSGFVDGQVSGVPYAPSVRRDFTLSTGVVVAGRVTDATGAPLADVRISFRSSPGAPAMDDDTTDAAGSYSVRVAPGAWTVVLDSRRDALGVSTRAGVAVAAPGPLVLDFAFPAPSPVDGRVLGELGPALPGASLELRGAATGARVDAVADAAGAYAAALVPDTWEAVVDPDDGLHVPRRFTFVVGSAPLARDFVLARGATVSGTVFASSGLPLREDTDVEVVLLEGSVFLAPDPVTTDPDDGTYTIGPVPLGDVTFQLAPPDDSGFPVQRFGRAVAAPGPATQDFVLAAGVVLSGTVFRDDGVTPEDNVVIEPVPAGGAPAPEDTKTDATGAFALSLFPGTYELRITPERANLQLPEVRTVTVAAATTLDVTLQRGVEVAGRLRLPDGINPAADVRITVDGALGASDVTDGAGDYAMLVPPGTHTLRFVAEDGPLEGIALEPRPGVTVLRPGPLALDLALSLATTGRTVVNGTVYAPDGATPVAGVAVEALDLAGEMLGRGTTDATGTYVIVIP